MIVWLASYPRSGNTLTRTILRRCFKAATHSVYDEGNPEELVRDMGLAAFCAMARASTETYFVKTHELPNENNDPVAFPGDRTIYVARDGRAAMSSHKQYLLDVSRQSFALEYVVAGAPPIVGWADHVTAWRDRSASSQLLLHYEALSEPSRETLERISAFIGRPLLRDFDVKFADLHVKNPTYFRVGHNEPGIQEVQNTCPALFWRINGPAMTRLGYAPEKKGFTPFPDNILREIRQAMTHTRALALGQARRSEAAGGGA